MELLPYLKTTFSKFICYEKVQNPTRKFYEIDFVLLNNHAYITHGHE